MDDTNLTLADLALWLAENTARLKDLRQKYDDATLMRKPREDAWSACECIEHLYITGQQYVPLITGLIQRHRVDRKTSGDTTLKPGRFARWFIKQAGPTNPKKLPAPKRFRPEPGNVDVAILGRFAEQQLVYSQLIDRAKGLPLNRGKFGSPITPLIRFTLGEALLLLIRHQQRHLIQAEKAASEEPAQN